MRHGEKASGSGDRTGPPASPGFSRIILTAGGLGLVVLAVAGIRNVPVPEWLTHLSISVVVVAIVHLLDRYVFASETREELIALSNRIVEETVVSTEKALDELTKGLEGVVEERTQTLLDQTKVSLEELSCSIAEDVGAGTRDALQELTETVKAAVLESSRELLDRTRISLDEILARQSTSMHALQASGISHVYATRREASHAIAAAMGSATVREVRVLGISLNDFFRGDEPELAQAWQRLKSVIRDPARDASVRVRVLMIDPHCQGAYLRSFAEVHDDRTVVGRLERDVESAADALVELERLAPSEPGSAPPLECKLYRLAPMMFMCHVDDRCFVQQYHFWTARESNTPIPVLEYTASPGSECYDMHSQLRQHFDLVWQYASLPVSEVISHAADGVDRAVGHLGLANVFTDPAVAAKRMGHLLKGAKERVYLQGISLKAFFATGASLFEPMLGLIADGRVEIKILVLDPDCEQAMVRAYRERLLQPQAQGTDFATYKKSGQHLRSQLYSNTQDTIEQAQRLVSDFEQNLAGWRKNFDVRLYDTAPACFMLLVDDRVLVEQYNYGKMMERKVGVPVTLGSDMPLFEYCRELADLYKDDATVNRFRSPYGLLRNHFEEFAFPQGRPVPLQGAPVRVEDGVPVLGFDGGGAGEGGDRE